MQCSTLSCYLLLLRPKYSPQHPILKHHQSTFQILTDSVLSCITSIKFFVIISQSIITNDRIVPQIRVNNTMYVEPKIDERQGNYCCSGKAIIITYSVCLQPQLSRMQSACAILHYHMWPVWLYNIIPHYLINGTIFE